MGRPRAFDEDEVLDAATGRFWWHGYAATSTRELGAAMRLGPASLYNAFGDKPSLFGRCLDRYVAAALQARMRRLEAELPPRAAIEAFLEELVAQSLADPRGCLLINAAVELGPHDPRLGARIAAGLSEIEAFLLRCLRAGQRRGTIATRLPAEDMARLLLAAAIGLRALARVRPEPALLRGAVAAALAPLATGTPDR